MAIIHVKGDFFDREHRETHVGHGFTGSLPAPRPNTTKPRRLASGGSVDDAIGGDAADPFRGRALSRLSGPLSDEALARQDADAIEFGRMVGRAEMSSEQEGRTPDVAQPYARGGAARKARARS